MPDADYDHINDSSDHYLSSYEEDDSENRNLFSKLYGYYHFAKRTGIDSIKWKYRGAKWYTRAIGYRLKHKQWPNPYHRTENAVYKYGYIEYAFIQTVDEIAFLPLKVNAMLNQVLDTRELLFTTEEAE